MTPLQSNSPRRRVRAAALLAALLATLGAAPPLRAAVEGYLNYPDHDGERVVFTAEGDLWIAPLSGGLATRLTSAQGNEYFGKFSPDGKTIAFSADYGGNRDVYLMPSDGGVPERLTWSGVSEDVVGWTADGQTVLFRSRRPPTYRENAIFSVSAAGGAPVEYPIGKAATLSIHQDGKTVAFTRTGNFFRTWNRYGGGTNEDIWVGDVAAGKFHQATEFHGMDRFPMWIADRLYFLTDRDGRSNIWSMDKAGGDLKQHTFHKDADARFSSEHGGKIVYHLMGDLWLFDSSNDSTKKIDILLPTDRPLAREGFADAMDYVETIAISDDGSSLAFGTRGNIYATSPKRGRVAAVAPDTEARVKGPAFSPDGETIAAWSTATGEEELWLYPSSGIGEARQLTKGSTEWHFAPKWSPDGKKIAWADSLLRVRYIDVESGAVTDVSTSPSWETNEYAWSPDSRFLAFAEPNEASHRIVKIHDLSDGATRDATESLFDSFSPAWDPEGEYLFFLSRRTIDPMIDEFDFETANLGTTKPYAIVLSTEVDPFTTPPEWVDSTEEVDDDDADDEEMEDGESEDEDDDEAEMEDEDEEEEQVEVVIDFDGILARTFPLAVESGSYYGLEANEDRVFWIAAPIGGLAGEELFDEEGGPENDIYSFEFGADDFDKREFDIWAEGVTDFDLSGDGSKMLVVRGDDLHVVGTKHGPDEEALGKGKVDVSRLSLKVDAPAEWRQILHDAYLYQRQFYYAPNMAGTDWDAAYTRFASLLPRLGSRSDLNDVIGELIAELGTGHTYVWGGGDVLRERAKGVSVGSLGADLAWDDAVGAYKIAKIYAGYAWENEISPLAAPHARIAEGNLLHAIDGQKLAKNADPAMHLANAADKAVLLTVSTDGTEETTRDVVVKALRGDNNLRYLDWVEANRRYVEEKTNGEFGYLHIPDMGGAGLVMFYRYFFPQIRKKAMVIDARFNGGGFVSQLIIARLARKPIAYGTARNSPQDYTYPDKTFLGPIVCLTNEEAGSDGDIFPAVFQYLKLGKVIGMRTWGGVVGIRGDKRFSDGGMTTQPEFAWWDVHRGWALENEGVYPDMVVNITPEDELANRDPQLDAAIAELQAQLATGQWEQPKRPPYPNTHENWKRRAAPFMTKP